MWAATYPTDKKVQKRGMQRATWSGSSWGVLALRHTLKYGMHYQIASDDKRPSRGASQLRPRALRINRWWVTPDHDFQREVAPILAM